MIVEGSVLLLACPDCGARHPHFRYAGDTDMVTYGLTCAGDRAGMRLSLFRAAQGDTGVIEDLRPAKLAGVIEHGPSAAGLDFQTFLKLRQPAELIFHCPWCDAGEMTVSREMTPAEFVEAGRRIDCIGAIELREGQAFS
jgi:hypothetical protein